jgi:hypothetical protein
MTKAGQAINAGITLQMYLSALSWVDAFPTQYHIFFLIYFLFFIAWTWLNFDLSDGSLSNLHYAGLIVVRGG